MGHQTLIVRIISAQLRQLKGAFQFWEKMKKYRDAVVQGVALTVDNTGFRKQGLNKTNSGKVPQQLVRDAVH